MPNWCDCELRIEGNETEIKRFKIHAMERIVPNPEIITPKGVEVEEPDNPDKRPEMLDANQFIPYPKLYKEMDKKAAAETRKIEKMSEKERIKYIEEHGYPKDGYNSGGYTWCCDNWGTKWGFCVTEMRQLEAERLFYNFQTAWSPPKPLIMKMSEMFPTLKFTLKYYECGAGFRGILICKKGKVFKDKAYKYKGGRGG